MNTSSDCCHFSSPPPGWMDFTLKPERAGHALGLKGLRAPSDLAWNLGRTAGKNQPMIEMVTLPLAPNEIVEQPSMNRYRASGATECVPGEPRCRHSVTRSHRITWKLEGEARRAAVSVAFPESLRLAFLKTAHEKSMGSKAFQPVFTSFQPLNSSASPAEHLLL